jgi:hypothetical protein
MALTVKPAEAPVLPEVGRGNTHAIILHAAVATAIVNSDADLRGTRIQRILQQAAYDTIQGGNDG